MVFRQGSRHDQAAGSSRAINDENGLEHITLDTSTFDTSTSHFLPIECLKRLGSSPMRRAGRLMVALALCTGAFTQTGAAQAEGHAGRRAIEKVAPVYPELARHAHIRGVVKLEVVVRPNGSVKSASASGGSPALIQSAIDAVRQWKFEAAREETTEIVQLMFEPQ
jgi:TonB family protein